MKKRILSLLFALALIIQVPVFADQAKTKKEDGTYDVPVYLKHFDKDRPSMGNIALRKIARVKVENGKANYKIYTSMMPFQKKEGGVEDFYIYNTNDKKSVLPISKTDFTKDTVKAIKEKADINEINTISTKTVTKDYPIVDLFKFEKEAGIQEIYVAVYVPAMGVKQKAILVFDWDKAELVAEEKEEPAKEEKKEEAKEDTTMEKLAIKDVPNEHWAYPAVNFVMQKGYFKGGSDGNFMPNDSITRGQFLTVLGRIAKVDTAKFAGASYNDVQEDIYYAPYIKWSQENKLCHIEGDKFMPDQALTREEMAYIMDKFITLTGKQLEDAVFTGFNDEASISAWAKDSVMAIANKGVIKGSNGNFDPKGNFTRAQVAQVLFNIYK